MIRFTHTAQRNLTPDPEQDQPAGAKPAAIPPGERDLAGYALHRSLQGTPLDQAQMSDLRRAQQAMAMTRTALHHGRGNVIEDIKRHPEVMSRVHAARVSSAGIEDAEGPIAARALRTAAARLAGAGMCSEFSNSTNHHYMAQMPEDGITTLVVSGKLPHVWVEARPATGSAIVMDAWRSGPAVLAQDSSNHELADREDRTSYNACSAREAMRRLGDIDRVMMSPAQHSQSPLANWASRLSSTQQGVLVQDRLVGYDIPPEFQFPDSSTLSRDFTTRAHAAWEKPSTSAIPPELRREVVAASVASTWAPSVLGRVSHAGEVLRAAQDLLHLPQPSLASAGTLVRDISADDSSSSGEENNNSGNPLNRHTGVLQPDSKWNSNSDSESDEPNVPVVERHQTAALWDSNLSNDDGSDDITSPRKEGGCVIS